MLPQGQVPSGQLQGTLNASLSVKDLTSALRDREQGVLAPEVLPASAWDGELPRGGDIWQRWADVLGKECSSGWHGQVGE